MLADVFFFTSDPRSFVAVRRGFKGRRDRCFRILLLAASVEVTTLVYPSRRPRTHINVGKTNNEGTRQKTRKHFCNINMAAIKRAASANNMMTMMTMNLEQQRRPSQYDEEQKQRYSRRRKLSHSRVTFSEEQPTIHPPAPALLVEDNVLQPSPQESVRLWYSVSCGCVENDEEEASDHVPDDKSLVF